MDTKNLAFSTDYPHGDSRYREAVDRFLKVPIAAGDKNILWNNCAADYAMQET